MPTCGRGMGTLLGPRNCESAMISMSENRRTRRCPSPIDAAVVRSLRLGTRWAVWRKLHIKKFINMESNFNGNTAKRTRRGSEMQVAKVLVYRDG